MNTKQFFTRGLASILLTLFMLSATHAEIPFTEALGMYQDTKKGTENISPFWAMVAVHGKLLERIRFFGFYTKTASGYDKALGDDKIAELLLTLFPSQDGIQFVPNAQDEHFKNLSKPENLKYINEIIEILLQGTNKTVKIRDIIKILTSSSTARSKVPVLLVSAYEQQAEYANPKLPEKQRYPENIVVIALLSFLVKVTDNQTSKLSETLPLLMNDTYLRPTDINKGFYETYKDHFSDIIRDFGTPSIKPRDIEMVFFLAKGFDMYENLVPEPVKYSQNITILGGPDAFSDCGETSLRNLFMLLLSAGNGGVVPIEKQDALEEKILQNKIASINDRTGLNQYEPYKKFKAFITNHPDITYGTSKEIHNAWAEIVSDLNKDSDKKGINRVQYGRKKTSANEEGYEIKSNFPNAKAKSIVNMFNVIARVIPDETLNKPWSEATNERYKEVAKKLDKLCFLFGNDMTVTWRNELTNSNTINSDFMSIIFTIQGQDAFRWIFQQGHFDLEHISTVKDDWRTKFTYANYQNEWLASLFTNLLSNKEKEQSYRDLHFPLTAIYNSSLKTLEGVKETIRMVLNKDLKNNKLNLETFYPLINRWVQQSIATHAENPNFLIDIIQFIATLPELPPISIDVNGEKRREEIIKDGMFIAKIKGLLDKNVALLAYKSDKKQAAEELIKAGAQINEGDEKGDTLLHLALDAKDMNIVNKLLEAQANTTIQNNDKRAPLHIAVSILDDKRGDDIDIMKKFILASHNINIQNKYGYTPLHFAVNQGKIEFINSLLGVATLDINLQNNDGNTPLHLAITKGKTDIIEMLLKESNLNVNLKNNEEETPLALAKRIGRESGVIKMLLERGATE